MGKDGEPVVRFELPPEWSDPPKVSKPAAALKQPPGPSELSRGSVGHEPNVRQRPTRSRMPRLTIRMPQQLVDALDERSAASGLGVSEHVRRILLEALKEV
jgi:hypothetical protein